MKLPDDFGIGLTPGTRAKIFGEIYRRQDGAYRLDLELQILAPQTYTDPEEGSDKLTQTVKPVQLLEALTRAEEEKEAFQEAIHSRTMTHDVCLAWLQSAPGAFVPFTAIRDIQGWTNVEAWSHLFFGKLPLCAPSGERGKKREEWLKKPAAVRDELIEKWRRILPFNRSRYEALSAMLREACILMQDSPTVEVYEISGADRAKIQVPDDPWFSRQQCIWIAVPRGMLPRDAIQYANEKANERGRAAKARVSGTKLDWLPDGVLDE